MPSSGEHLGRVETRLDFLSVTSPSHKVTWLAHPQTLPKIHTCIVRYSVVSRRQSLLHVELPGLGTRFKSSFVPVKEPCAR
jgi:hypothetical protein